MISTGTVYVVGSNGSGLRRLSSGGAGGYDEFFGFSPDGTMLAFDRIQNGIGSIFTMNTSGADLHELTPSASDDDYWGVWSPDGTKIAFDRTAASAFGDIWTMNADGGRSSGRHRRPGQPTTSARRGRPTASTSRSCPTGPACTRSS